ncbi:hypothetical protein BKA56DRAFT_592827 [Ilyonectria sp. MPI-CAGE-AT-0026]|nr:hypothetical protein BKA56DRAFT_592827 [Ilyonectria sp. MPI-CAGE-AT-0026]
MRIARPKRALIPRAYELTRSSPYKRVLLIGAASGMGAALADKFIPEGSKVIAVGRARRDLMVLSRSMEGTRPVA